jgi:hypothetical protein
VTIEVSGHDSSWAYLGDHFGLLGPLMLAVFTIYLIALAITEFLSHWRRVIVLSTGGAH